MQLSSNNTLASKTQSNNKINDGTSIVFSDLSGTIFKILKARANIRHIQFDLPEEGIAEESTHQISIEGPFIINLISGETTPDIGDFPLDPGTYKRIDARLDDTKLEDGLIETDDILFENTIIVEGEFDYGGIIDRKYSIILKFNEDVRFEEPNGISIEEGGTRNIILKLLVDDWLHGVDITSCLTRNDLFLQNNGDLVIDDSNGKGDCQDLEETIKTNIKNNYDFN